MVAWAVSQSFPGVGPYRPSGLLGVLQSYLTGKTLSKLEEPHQHWLRYFRTKAIKQPSSAFARTLHPSYPPPPHTLLIPSHKALSCTAGSWLLTRSPPSPGLTLLHLENGEQEAL